MSEDARSVGVVKVFYPLKGFGFITRTKGKDLFFHFRDIETHGYDSALLEGDKVDFIVGNRDGKAKAIKVRKIG